MSEQHDIRSENEMQFRKTALRVLEAAGFMRYIPENKFFGPQSPQGLLKKGDHIYCLETFYSRRVQYTSRAILTTGELLIRHAKKQGWLPLIVVGGVLTPALWGDLLGKSVRTVVLDIENLLYMARENRELYDELVAQLPYSTADLRHRKPEFLPLPDWNAAYAGKKDWQITAAVLRPDPDKTVAPLSDDTAETDAAEQTEPDASGEQSEQQPAAKKGKGTLFGIDVGTTYSTVRQLFDQTEDGRIKRDIQSWQGGRQSASAAYEKLCTRTLMRLFADDLTLWKEQAKSDAGLFRFDLICKIKRDNGKEFWEMAERYFNSKYIIFEFKNYTGKVTQKEVFTTVRYLYTKALRGIAIIVSPNGIDDHADKAIRGVLRDEGKLILSLTNQELISMLEMKENGEDPADYLSDKLDALLIDLEK